MLWLLNQSCNHAIMQTSLEQTCKYTIILSSQVQVPFEAHRHTDTLTHWKLKHCVTDTQTHRYTDTKTHRHTDRQPHRQTRLALQSITNYYLWMENPSFEKKNLIQKPFLLGILF